MAAAAPLARNVNLGAVPAGYLLFNQQNPQGVPDQPYYRDMNRNALTANEMREAGMPVSDVLAYGIIHYIPGVQELYDTEVRINGSGAAGRALVGQLMQTGLAAINGPGYVPATHQVGHRDPVVIPVPVGSNANVAAMYGAINAVRAADPHLVLPRSVNVVTLPDVEILPRLNRRTDYRKWKRQYELIAENNHWQRLQQLSAIKLLLAGDTTLYEGFIKWMAEQERIGVIPDPPQMLAYLDGVFSPKPGEKILLLHNLNRIVQEPFESVETFYDRVESELHKTGTRIDPAQKMSTFITGLKSDLQIHLLTGLNNDADIESLLLKAKLLEYGQKEGKIPQNLYGEKVQQAQASGGLTLGAALAQYPPVVPLAPLQTAPYNTQAQLQPPVPILPSDIGNQLLVTMQQLGNNIQDLANNRNQNNNRNNQQNYRNNNNANNQNNNRNARQNSRNNNNNSSGYNNNNQNNNNNQQGNNNGGNQGGRKRNNDSRDNQPSGGSNGPYQYTRPCEYCGMENHSIENCYKRINAEQAQAFRDRAKNAAAVNNRPQ